MREPENPNYVPILIFTNYVPILIFIGASLFFALGAPLSLEWTDEGQIVYPSWRVSQGAVPYRDFHHLYAPSLFFLNGLLFRCFGADLLVLRVFLVLLKSGTCVLVYFGAMRLASLPFALAVSALLIVSWGGPWWAFNTPYANHYAITLMLAGGLLFLHLRRRFALACAAAGLLFGLAATFKQTTGVFASIAFALFLLLDRHPGDTTASAGFTAAWVRPARLIVILAALAVAAVYLSPRNTVWNLAVVAAPLGVLIVRLFVAEVRTPLHGPSASHALVGLLWCGIGMAVPLLAYFVLYGAMGGLSGLLFDLVHGLPSKMRWFRGYPVPGWRTAIQALGIVALMKAYTGWRTAALPLWRLPAAVGTACALAAGALLVQDVVLAGGIVPFSLGHSWYGQVVFLLFLLPPAIVWGWLSTFLHSLRPGADADGEKPLGEAARLFFCFGATSLLFLYPAADFWHVLMILPPLLPLLAAELEGFSRPYGVFRGRSMPASIVAPTVCVLLLGVLAAPFVHALGVARWERPASFESFRRARTIFSPQPHFAEVQELLASVESIAQPDRPLLMLTNEPMVYFLSGRKSALDRDEFILYLVGSDIIGDEEARRLVGDGIAQRLASASPLVISRADSRAAERLRRAFPEAASYIETHCDPRLESGGYEILDCRR